jgi:hypothetical protein
MRIQDMHLEAENCRRHAGDFQHQPEGAFLLRLASSFEDLAKSRGLMEVRDGTRVDAS